VNASVPKTLIQHLIRWVIRSCQFDPEACRVLAAILDRESSPELVPGEQHSERTIGPYELQDFNLYYISRYGFRPSKVAFLAHRAWSDRYDLATIKKWLGVFLQRFFQESQFKRSALPNAPKVGSGGSLSPRSDWRAPSDAVATAWLDELRENVPERWGAERPIIRGPTSVEANMKNIRNKTRKPLKVQLPGGRFLHLGPAKTGQVSDQAAEQPSFQKLLERGEIEIVGVDGSAAVTSEGAPTVAEATHGRAQTKIVLPKGNR
jgi:hypothetical protein